MNLEFDLKWLKHAIDISRKAPANSKRYRVGCVIVSSDNKEIASSYTGELEESAHAEEGALLKAKQAGLSLQGACIYSSLEPCSQRPSGKISCCERIIAASIARVVFALREPAHFVKCEGVMTLKSRGVEVVELSDLGQEVLEINGHLL